MGKFVDLSIYQSLSIDWMKYKAWSSADDGISRVAIRSSYGTGFMDGHYRAFRAGAEAVGIDQIYYYHYSYPSLNSPEAEANYQKSVVGSVRPGDLLFLDFEEKTVQATASWALAWLQRQEANYAGRLPGLYASTSYIKTRLQDARLAKYPLWLAQWTYDPANHPSCPSPWSSYMAFQYTDKAASIPGISGQVDASVYVLANPIQTVGATMATTTGGENATFINNISQLEAGETEDACVAFSAANVFYATPPGVANPHTPEDVDQLADKWYTKFTGSINSSAGLSVGQLQAMLSAFNLKWQTIPISNNGPANDEAVRTALRAGKIVIVCAAESSFFDLELGRPPYSWNTKPFNHCIVVSGLITSGPYTNNVWVRDTVAVSGGYPPSTKRPYDLGKMQYVSLTAVTPVWLKGKKTMDISDPLFTKHFKVVNGTLVCENTFVLHGAILTHFLTSNGYSELGLPLSNEIVIDATKYPGVVYQRFERGVVVYDPKRAVDDAPGVDASDSCYRGHIDIGVGADPRVATLQAELDALKQLAPDGLAAVAQQVLVALKTAEASLVALLPKP